MFAIFVVVVSRNQPTDFQGQCAAGALGIISVNGQDSGAVTGRDRTAAIIQIAAYISSSTDHAAAIDDRTPAGIEAINVLPVAKSAPILTLRGGTMVAP